MFVETPVQDACEECEGFGEDMDRGGTELP